MRIPALAIFTFAAALTAAPAWGQTYDPAYPVCLHVYTRGANFYECLYTSLPSATRRHRVARHNASSIRISQARKYPSDGIGGIAAFVDEVAKPCRRGQMHGSAADPDAARLGCFTTTFSMRTWIGSRSNSARRNQQ
jgi:hypothetical protein